MYLKNSTLAFFRNEISQLADGFEASAPMPEPLLVCQEGRLARTTRRSSTSVTRLGS